MYLCDGGTGVLGRQPPLETPTAGERLVVVTLYFLPRCMRPEGPWQRWTIFPPLNQIPSPTMMSHTGRLVCVSFIPYPLHAARRATAAAGFSYNYLILSPATPDHIRAPRSPSSLTRQAKKEKEIRQRKRYKGEDKREHSLGRARPPPDPRSSPLEAPSLL